jgi:hypothetical protein
MSQLIEVEIWHENRATMTLLVPNDFDITHNPETRKQLTELALREMDEGRSHFDAVDGDIEWRLLRSAVSP